MATAPTPIKIGPFNLGMNNRLPETNLEVPKVGTYLRSAVNVDITGPGTLKRREGYAQSLPGTDLHSLWSDNDETYVVDGTTLYYVTGAPDDLSKAVVRTGLKPGVPMSYTRAAGDIVCSDGETLFKLLGSTHNALSVPMMDSEPSLSITAGNLIPGVYQMCFAYVAADYRISGTTQPIAITVGEDEGIFVTGLPAALPSGITAVAVYMTEPNGDELFMASAIDSPTHAVTFPPSLSGRCQTLNLKPLPGGSIVRHNNGRFFVAQGNLLLYSEPFSTLYDPSKNFVQFASALTVVEGLTKGLYVCTETGTFYFAGDITNTESRQLLPYGAVPGTGGTYPDKLRAFWMSTRGLIQGDDSGEVKNVQEAAIAMDVAQAGASLFREQDGKKQVIASLFGSDMTAAAAYSYMDAEIVRKGTVL